MVISQKICSGIYMLKSSFIMKGMICCLKGFMIIGIPSGRCLTLLISTDNEIYGGKENCRSSNEIVLDNGCVDIKINAFTGMMFEIIWVKALFV